MSPRAIAISGMMLVLPVAVARILSASSVAVVPPAIRPTLKVRFGSGSSLLKAARMRDSS